VIPRDHRHGANGDFSVHPTGSTHHAKMAKQTKPGYIDRSSEKSSLGQFRPNAVELTNADKHTAKRKVKKCSSY
jgi:hypothetical protein